MDSPQNQNLNMGLEIQQPRGRYLTTLAHETFVYSKLGHQESFINILHQALVFGLSKKREIKMVT